MRTLCTATGLPHPVIQWRYNTSTNSTTVLDNELYINTISLLTTTIYNITCVAYNAVGIHSMTSLLEIISLRNAVADIMGLAQQPILNFTLEDAMNIAAVSLNPNIYQVAIFVSLVLFIFRIRRTCSRNRK